MRATFAVGLLNGSAIYPRRMDAMSLIGVPIDSVGRSGGDRVRAGGIAGAGDGRCAGRRGRGRPGCEHPGRGAGSRTPGSSVARTCWRPLRRFARPWGSGSRTVPAPSCRRLLRGAAGSAGGRAGCVGRGRPRPPRRPSRSLRRRHLRDRRGRRHAGQRRARPRSGGVGRGLRRCFDGAGAHRDRRLPRQGGVAALWDAPARAARPAADPPLGRGRPRRRDRGRPRSGWRRRSAPRLPSGCTSTSMSSTRTSSRRPTT